MDLDLVIRNGTVITSSDTMHADVGVREGRIVSVSSVLPAGRREIDANGLLVLPGGVDTHVHVEQRGAPISRFTDTFESATLSASFGGTTTLISHCRQEKGESLSDSLKEYNQKANNTFIDCAFHLMVTDVTQELLYKDLVEAAEAGHTSVKIFMAGASNFLDDAAIIRLLARVRELGLLPVIHAENHSIIEWLARDLSRLGYTSARYKAVAQPVAVEREAIHRILSFSEILDVPVHLFHVTSAEAVDEIERAQARGVQVTGEVCPQHLYFTEGDLIRPLEDAVKLTFSPPPRSLSDQEALWSAIRRGSLDVMSSDHAPYPYSGRYGKLETMRRGGFSATPYGVPGLETRMMLFYSEGVANGRIDVNRFVGMTATNPAKRFGLYPSKGSILIGGDADFVLWDSDKITTIKNKDLHHRVEYTPYEGMRVKGAPYMTISRGRVITEGDTVVGSAGWGRILRRSRVNYEDTKHSVFVRDGIE